MKWDNHDVFEGTFSQKFNLCKKVILLQMVVAMEELHQVH